MADGRERRFSAATIEVREVGGEAVISGHAAVFNVLSEDLGGFRERIMPGAFAAAIEEGQDVRCLFNHDSNFVLGRTLAGTLSLREDAVGLAFECKVPNTQAGRDIVTSIERGDVTGCSFSFVVRKGGEHWVDDVSPPIREITAVDLFDVGPVVFPAYPATDVTAARRSLESHRRELVDSELQSLRLRIEAAEACEPSAR